MPPRVHPGHCRVLSSYSPVQPAATGGGPWLWSTHEGPTPSLQNQGQSSPMQGSARAAFLPLLTGSQYCSRPTRCQEPAASASLPLCTLWPHTLTPKQPALLSSRALSTCRPPAGDSAKAHSRESTCWQCPPRSRGGEPAPEKGDSSGGFSNTMHRVACPATQRSQLQG